MWGVIRQKAGAVTGISSQGLGLRLRPVTSALRNYSSETKEMTVRDALNSALDQEMAADPNIFVMGEEVGEYQGAYKITKGLLDKYGPERVVDTPITEAGFAGIGVGSAYHGLRPVIEFMTFNFSMQASDAPMNRIRSLRNLPVTSGLGTFRTFAAGAKAKKAKGAAASDAPKQSTLSKEVKSTTVVGANILKDGTDPKVLADSEYPEWLWHLLDKKPALSELRRKNVETLQYEELKRFVKLDNRARIKENNTTRAKN